MTSTFLFLIHVWKFELNLLLESVMKVCQHLCSVIQMIPECILKNLKGGNKEDDARLSSKVHKERQGATNTSSNKENFKVRLWNCHPKSFFKI